MGLQGPWLCDERNHHCVTLLRRTVCPGKTCHQHPSSQPQSGGALLSHAQDAASPD